MFLFGAADRIESIKVLPPSRPAASGCPPDIRIFNCSSPVSLDAKKEYPGWGIPFFGAADRTRTGTESPPADFKSAVSTIPPQRRGLPNHFSTVFRGSQGRESRFSCRGDSGIALTSPPPGSIRRELVTFWDRAAFRGSGPPDNPG